MIDSSRPAAAPQSPLAHTAIGLLLCAVALITLALSLAGSLGTPAFLALIGAELLLIAAMGALFSTVQAQGTAADAAARQKQRDEAALDALEPLRGGEQR